MEPTGIGEAEPSRRLLTPHDHVLLLVDHQSTMGAAVGSQPVERLAEATTGLARTAALFGIPAIITSALPLGSGGELVRGLREAFPDTERWIERTALNPWQDDPVRRRIERSGKPKVVAAGVWTEVGVLMPALCAVESGYDAYAITDASGGANPETHDRAVQRMVQAGVQPMTWLQYLLELQRDWTRSDTATAAGDIIRDHAGACGLAAEDLARLLDR
ncbi:isochorismatase family protein [Saccharopolyspora cebuensis]|uniref:Isochorismatase family protein n=1 Tax=Saccharopolyspora cebuensis TaxID=418759 RepID=A0ABV4CVI5_9PSEU